MKARVMMPFKDKETGKMRKVGEVIEVTPTRFKEIKKSGRYVAPVTEEAKAEEAQEEKPVKKTAKK